MEQNNVNILVSKYLLGTATPEEMSLLGQMKREYPHMAELLRDLEEEDSLARHYSEYMEIDKDTALQRFKEKTFARQEETSSEEPSRSQTQLFGLHNILLKVAAVALALIAVGAGWWYSDYTKVTPPEIAQEVRQAMRQSEETGKNVAKVETPSALSPRKAVISEEASSQLAQAYEVIQENYDLEDLRRVTTVHDKEFWVTLDDGTLVHLNYNSKIIYPEKFGRKDREVILDGEAYFMVAKDRSRKFVVHTPDGDVTVLGTEFNVNTRAEVLTDEEGNDSYSSPESEQVTTEVVLTKGSITASMNGNEVSLRPGQKVIFDTQHTSLNISEVDTEPYVAWNTGTFVFNDVALGKVMDVLSRWYRMKTVFESDDLKNIKLYSNFDRYGDIEPILKGIGIVTGLEIRIHDNTITVRQ